MILAQAELPAITDILLNYGLGGAILVFLGYIVLRHFIPEWKRRNEKFEKQVEMQTKVLQALQELARQHINDANLHSQESRRQGEMTREDLQGIREVVGRHSEAAEKALEGLRELVANEMDLSPNLQRAIDMHCQAVQDILSRA